MQITVQLLILRSSVPANFCSSERKSSTISHYMHILTIYTLFCFKCLVATSVGPLPVSCALPHEQLTNRMVISLIKVSLVDAM